MSSRTEAMGERDEDLQATAEALVADASMIEALEREKAAVGAEDPRAAQLARRVEALVARMSVEARAQTTITDEALD
jgi:hypothetical protein